MINDMFRTSLVAASGLRAGRVWMNVLSNNISNMNTVDTGIKDASGNYIPYAREVPVFAKVLSEKFRENKVNKDVLNGVKVDQIALLKESVKKVYDPTNPAARLPGTADAGYVYYPGVNLAQEMADLKIASASYEANLTVIGVDSKMMQGALAIGRSS